MRDRLISCNETVSARVTCPVSMGILRSSSLQPWMNEALEAHTEGRRAVLCSGLHSAQELMQNINRLREEWPHIRLALFTHWTEVLAYEIPNELRQEFDEIFIAVDSHISPLDGQKINQTVQPRWVLVPRVGMNWEQLICEALIPSKRGRLTLLAPEQNSPDGPFLSCDEILLNIEELQVNHPLIEIRPAQHEWFVPSALKPWHRNTRDRSFLTSFYRGNSLVSESFRDFSTFSFVIPLQWLGQPEQIELLKQALASCLKVADHLYLTSDKIRIEYVVVIDHEIQADSFPCQTLLNGLDIRVANNLLLKAVPRHSKDPDWRAGWIRNLGADASHTAGSGYLIFLDADCTIASPKTVAEALTMKKASLFFTLVDEKARTKRHHTLPFTSCSSRLMICHRSTFETLGQFSEAFTTYGCEDNFLVWLAYEALQRGHGLTLASLPENIVTHLRAKVGDDRLAQKMLRLQNSASLFYRMSLDPRVHQYFFSSLGPTNSSSLYLRALFKSAVFNPILHLALSWPIFLLTLLQSRNRLRYLRGVADLFAWSLRAPFIRMLGARKTIWHRTVSIARQVPWVFPAAASFIKSILTSKKKSGQPHD